MYSFLKKTGSRILPPLNSKDEKDKKKEDEILIEDDSKKNYFSALPRESQLKAAFKDAYVINQPKEVVGGDGYWCFQRNDFSFLVVFDCASHGRLATMMTRVYLKAINKIIVSYNYREPGLILNEIHKIIKAEFEENKAQQLVTSAEMGVLMYNSRQKKLQFAGAGLGLISVSQGGVTGRVRGTRRSIGNHFDAMRFYKTHLLKLDEHKVTKYYLYSDGVTDLFGGPDKKKLSDQKLSEMLASCHDMSFGLEKIEMQTRLSNWSGINDILDDMLLIGVSI